MTAFRALVALMCIGFLLSLLSYAERTLCEQVMRQRWKAAKWAHVAIERVYYLRDGAGRMLYVGQTVDEDRRWDQHQADGRKRTRKADWASTISREHCSVVRYAWTYDQSMRIERRRTISIYLAFATVDLLQIGAPRQIHNVSNTPHDPRKKVKVHEWAVAALFLPFYFLEGWMLPNAQWTVPVLAEELDQ